MSFSIIFRQADKMGLDIEFLAPFDKSIIQKKEYDRLQDFLRRPVEVLKGQVVARAIKPEESDLEGESGVTFRAPAGKRIDDYVGENLRLSNKETPEIISAIDGYLCAKEEGLAVTKDLEVFGDVGPQTGNIISPTSVRIHGGVASGFKVVLKGDVEITGLVEGGRVEARGKVFLREGIVGSGEGYALAGGDLYAKFAQQCRLESGGSITMDGPAMNCELAAAMKVTLRGKSSSLVGGVTRAGAEVFVAKAGSQGALPTEVHIGYNPFKAKRHELWEERMNALMESRKIKEKEVRFAVNGLSGALDISLEDILSAVFHLSEMVRSGDTKKLRKDQVPAFNNLAAGLLSVIGIDVQINRLKTKNAKDELGTSSTNAVLKVSDVAHPGVKLSILDKTIHLDHEFERVRFVLKKDKIEAVVL